jgi:hypothetical protein
MVSGDWCALGMHQSPQASRRLAGIAILFAVLAVAAPKTTAAR